MNKIYVLVLFSWLLIFANVEAEMKLPVPYDKAELLPFRPEGFYANATAMEQIFAEKTPKVIVEVGCWLGVSTMHMGSMLPVGGVIYAVDHWLGSIEHQPNQPFWSPILPKLYDQFLSNIIHAELTDKIIPVRMSSLEASIYLSGLKADLIYIDASHDYESVYADLYAWYPLIKDGGTFCGDDWHHPPIKQAVYQFADEQNLKVVVPPKSNMWILKD